MLLQIVAMFPRDAFCLEPSEESMQRAIQSAGLTPTSLGGILVPSHSAPYTSISSGLYMARFKLPGIVEPQSGTLYWLRCEDGTVTKLGSRPFKDENLWLLVENAALFWAKPEAQDRIALLIGE